MSSYRSLRRSARYAVAIASLLAFSPTLAAAGPPDSAVAQAPPARASNAAVVAGGTTPPADAPGTGQRIAGFSLIGVGAVGVVIGAVFGLSVPEKNRAIDAICPTGQPCPPQSMADYNNAVADAKIARAAAWIGFGVGAVFVGTGLALVLTAPQRASGTAIWLTPAFGSSGSGAALAGTW